MKYVFLLFRKMRGEDLQGLTIEELQNLEKTLETGLSRVLERKACSLDFNAFCMQFGFIKTYDLLNCTRMRKSWNRSMVFNRR